MYLLFIKKSSKNIRFSALESCFWGPNHRYDDVYLPEPLMINFAFFNKLPFSILIPTPLKTTFLPSKR
jgi:hypothetical protein